MKILSFDVGIKNLSFCVLNDKIIEDWGILNICTDDVCDHCSKDGKRCDKSAKFIDKDGFKVCPGHSKLKSYSDKKFKKVSKKDNPMLDQGKCIVENLQKKDIFLDVDTGNLKHTSDCGKRIIKESSFSGKNMFSDQFNFFMNSNCSDVNYINSLTANLDLIDKCKQLSNQT